MKIRREIASIPLRTAGETWQAICDLITSAGTIDGETLKSAASVMESLIADETAATVPIVVKGVGPRLVIYCLYNEAAMETGTGVDPLNWNPTGGSAWQMTAPSEAADVSWMNTTLKHRAPRISIHDVASPPADEDDAASTASTAASSVNINWGPCLNMSTTFASAYARVHTAAFASDKMRNLIKLLVQFQGLDPTALMDAWSGWVDRAARSWMESGHLRGFTIDFYKPGTTVALARWDFPIRYDGNGVDEMWVDRELMQSSFAKSTRPPAGCIYRVTLNVAPGAPDVTGVGDATSFSINGLVAREAGTVIATPDLMASATYYR